MTSTDSNTDAPSLDTAAGAGQRRGFGIDVGGSGIKGGIVDLDTGALIGDRYKLLTPQPATPSAVAKKIAEGGRRIRVDRSARSDLSRRGHPRHRPDGGQRRQGLDRNQCARHHRRRAGRPAGHGPQRCRRGRARRRALWRGQRQIRVGGAADVRNRNRVRSDPQRQADTQHRVRPSRGRRQRGRATRGVVGQGKERAGATRSGPSR